MSCFFRNSPSFQNSPSFGFRYKCLTFSLKLQFTVFVSLYYVTYLKRFHSTSDEITLKQNLCPIMMVIESIVTLPFTFQVSVAYHNLWYMYHVIWVITAVNECWNKKIFLLYYFQMILFGVLWEINNFILRQAIAKYHNNITWSSQLWVILTTGA